MSQNEVVSKDKRKKLVTLENIEEIIGFLVRRYDTKLEAIYDLLVM